MNSAPIHSKGPQSKTIYKEFEFYVIYCIAQCTLCKIINSCTLQDYFIQISKLITFFKMPKGIYDRNVIATPSIPQISYVMHLWSKTEHHTVKCLINANMRKVPEVCESCGAYNSFNFKSITTKLKFLRCSKKQCRHQISIFIFYIFILSKYTVIIKNIIEYIKGQEGSIKN